MAHDCGPYSQSTPSALSSGECQVNLMSEVRFVDRHDGVTVGSPLCAFGPVAGDHRDRRVAPPCSVSRAVAARAASISMLVTIVPASASSAAFHPVPVEDEADVAVGAEGLLDRDEGGVVVAVDGPAQGRRPERHACLIMVDATMVLGSMTPGRGARRGRPSATPCRGGCTRTPGGPAGQGGPGARGVCASGPRSRSTHAGPPPREWGPRPLPRLAARKVGRSMASRIAGTTSSIGRRSSAASPRSGRRARRPLHGT